MHNKDIRVMNTGGQISFVSSRETIYFSHWNDCLCQWIFITVENRVGNTLPCTVEIAFGNRKSITPLDLHPGNGDYRCYAPCLFPERITTPAEAHFLLKMGETLLETNIPAGNFRPWKIYLLSDVCSDMTWRYSDWDAMCHDDALLTHTELALAEETRQEMAADQNHYNLNHSHEISYFLEQFPEAEQGLANSIRRGEITLNPFHTMVITADISLEEQIRQFYPARNWAIKHGLEIGDANHQETPTISWSMAMVLAGSGIRHLVKAILPYECPWVERLVEPPLFIWEGPDGSRILMRRRNIDYVEGDFLFKGIEETNKTLHETVIPEYEAFGQRYPFDAIAVLGLYGDLTPENWISTSDSQMNKGEIVPQCHPRVSEKINTIKAYNNQGWEYPKLFNAGQKQFWDDVDCQITERKLSLEIYRGDYGTSWDAWPVCLAYDVAAWRRVQEHIGAADKLAALSSFLGISRSVLKENLAEAWQNLVYLSDHAWNGANDANRQLNKALRRRWQETANHLADKVVAAGLVWLSESINSEDENFVCVFNSLGWERSGQVRLEGFNEQVRVQLPDNEPVSMQTIEEDGEEIQYFEAKDIPPLGYRVFQIAAGESVPDKPVCVADGYHLEGPFYSLDISPVTGGITRLYDKVRGRELAKPDNPYHLNQCVYLSEKKEYVPQQSFIISTTSGAIFGQVMVQANFQKISLKTTYRLYNNLDRVDITNDLEKEPTGEQQELDFFFPFNVQNPQMRYEAPAAIIEPRKDHLEGAGLAVTAVRHFVDVFNDQHGITLSQADSFLVEFGHRTTQEDPKFPDTSNGTIIALALGNLLDWKENFHDQGGERNFTFRYSLRGHEGGFDPSRDVHFGWEDNNEMVAVPLKGIKNGILPKDQHSFVSVTPSNVILTCMKSAEEEGIILRLWECGGVDTIAQVNITGLENIRKAWLTDLLERNLDRLSIKSGIVEVPIKGSGLATVRLIM
jgi:alpha-mannosidase